MLISILLSLQAQREPVGGSPWVGLLPALLVPVIGEHFLAAPDRSPGVLQLFGGYTTGPLPRNLRAKCDFSMPRWTRTQMRCYN